MEKAGGEPAGKATLTSAEAGDGAGMDSCGEGVPVWPRTLADLTTLPN